MIRLTRSSRVAMILMAAGLSIHSIVLGKEVSDVATDGACIPLDDSIYEETFVLVGFGERKAGDEGDPHGSC